MIIKKDYSVDFVYALGAVIRKYAVKHSAGSTFAEISGKELAKTPIRISSLDEQKCIGEFFKTLDDLITAHERKLELLRLKKRYYLQQIFSRKLRFRGFTEPWRQRKLNELASFGGGHTPSMADSENYSGGKILWVTSQDVKQRYIETTTNLLTKRGAAELNVYPEGSLIMVTRSGILRHMVPVSILRKPATVNQDIRVIQPHSKNLAPWLFQFFISHQKLILLRYGKTGTTVESIDFKSLKEMVLSVPTDSEMELIGLFLDKIDCLIDCYALKVDLSQRLKSAYLRTLFI
ncbi:HsdS specificity protein of type I restriction-modification system [Bifidobacterium samirii]|uniref:HsdS specificity protein of type I restriction-modification system n=2 Tax=Bifidobacterium samirii TaxID=2306974 RepID=A0A430FU25_9BIFI|nr:HsdS specificity protein of type I restriction-modification system [Bifidobacterium samirii]